MEVSGIAGSSIGSSRSSNSSLHGLSETKSKSIQKAGAHDDVRFERSQRSNEGARGKALGMFRQELRSSLRAFFNVRLENSQSPYANGKDTNSPDSIANEALGAAKQVIAESPATAAKSLITFRAKVHESASIVRTAIGNSADNSEIDGTVAKVDDGISALSDKLRLSEQSTATVLDVDTRSKQRSTIKIRTQEGDIVKLSLTQKSKVSISDQAVIEDGVTRSQTDVEISSRSRLSLKVEGDLNAAEYDAILSVFAKAENIADEFFSGDIAAAFEAAEGFEFDSSQLAAVRLGFRASSRSTVSYRETTISRPVIEAARPAAEPTSAIPIDAPPFISSPVVEVDTIPKAGPVEGSKPSPALGAPDNDVAPPATVVDESGNDSSGLSNLFASITAFMRSVGEGFTAERESTTLHYSRSFKLEILKAVFHAVAPPTSQGAAETVESTIDKLVNDEATNA